MFHYTATRSDLELSSSRLFAAVRSGAVKVTIGQTYPLADAATAHRDLEGRRTTGSTVLLP
jgi:NADPH2:quinone reductase